MNDARTVALAVLITVLGYLGSLLIERMIALDERIDRIEVWRAVEEATP